MNVVKPIVEALGADHRQWQALTRAMYKARRPGVVSRTLHRSKSPSPNVGPNPVLYGVVGILLAGVAYRLPTISDAAALALSAFMLTTFASLMTEYAEPLAHEGSATLRSFPVSNRTFFICHLTNLLGWTGWLVVFVATPTLLLVLVREGVLPLIGWIAAIALSATFVAFFVATLFASRDAFDPARRWIAHVCFLVGSVFLCLALAGPIFAIESYDAPTVVTQPLMSTLIYPPFWFAALVDVARGTFAARSLLFVGCAIVCTWAAFFAMERMWMRHQIALSRGQPVASPSSSPSDGGWGWLPAEARICATLIWAHFRNDGDFRLRVAAGLPFGLALLGLSLLHHLGVEAIVHRLDAFMSFGLIHVAAVAVPLSWLGTLRCSDAFRATWIFWSTPVDMGKVLLWSGACVGAFALPFLILVGVVLFVVLGGGWRPLAHAASLTLVIYLIINVALIVRPQAPFSEPRARRKATSFRDLVGHAAGWGLAFLFLPVFLSAASSWVWSAVCLSLVQVVVIAGLARTVVLRGRGQLSADGHA